jgi:hypothetical protein
MSRDAFNSVAKLVLVAGCLSLLGGYLLSKLFLGVDASSAKRSVQLLEIEEYLDDAAIGLGRQIQEWKDMLLRVNDRALHARHQQGFKEASIDVQYALMKARNNMVEIGMGAADIDSLIVQHKTLLTDYLQAYAELNPGEASSREQVDKKVLGVDRNLQARIVQLKSGISEYAKQQLSRAPETQGHRSLMIGLLGGVLLFMMALLGFGFARRVSAV